MLPYIAEFLGTMMLIILGDGVVANVNLNKSGMKGSIENPPFCCFSHLRLSFPSKAGDSFLFFQNFLFCSHNFE